jgi:diacylglycerol kinase (ATP)
VVAALQRRGCTVVVRRTGPASGDAERLAREAEADFDVIVAAGGDGTCNSVANGMAGSPRGMAVLPFGTANVLAREIGLPRRPEPLAELIATGQARPIWPGRVDGRLFLTVAGSGFDAETVVLVNPWLKRHLGRFAFAWAIVKLWWRYRASELCVEIDGVGHPATTVIAANGRFYAGPYLIAPQGDLAEPMLEFALFRRSGRVAVLRYLAALLLGRLPQRDDITFLRSRGALVSSAAFLPVQADGEIVARLPAAFAVAGRPLLLIQP